MPERDGDDQEQDSPKQACSYWFTRHSWLATSSANLYPSGNSVLFAYSIILLLLFSCAFVSFSSSFCFDSICGPSVLPGCNNIFAFMIIFKKLFHYVLSLSSSHPSCLGRAGGHSLLFRGRPLRGTADSEPYRSTGKVNVEWYLTLYPKTRVQRASC